MDRKPLTGQLVEAIVASMHALDDIPRLHPTRIDWTALDSVIATHIDVWSEKQRET
jgi:hypothetical protein